MSSSDYIAIIAIIIALVVPGIQFFYGRRREWHEACEFLCNDLSSLFDDINSLVLSPSKVNHISFQYYIKRRIITLKLYGKRFFLQRGRIGKVKKIIINKLMELPKQIEYERLLILGNTEELYYYNHFCENVRDNILAASQLLIK